MVSSTTTATSATEPSSSSSSPQIGSQPTQTYITIAKLITSLLIFILTAISASIWPQHLHPVFLSTLFTCVATFAVLIYSHNHVPSSASKCSHYIATLLSLHILPFVLWVAPCVLTSLWTHTHHDSTWRTVEILDANRSYLAELPPGLTPAKIASDFFRRHHTVEYTAAVRMTGVCAGLAGLAAVFFAVSGIRFVMVARQQRQAHVTQQARSRKPLAVPGYVWLAAVVSRIRRKETLPMLENENVVKSASTDPSVHRRHS